MENQKQKQKKYKNSLPKRLSNIFFVLFFCIFSAFTLIAYSSTNYFLLKKEKQSVFQAVNIVRVRLSEVDSNFTLENLAEVLYKNDKTHLRIDDRKGSRVIRSERDITNTLDANQDIYVYNIDKQMIFTTDNEESSPGLHGPIGRVYHDHIEDQYRGFSMTQKVYSNRTGKFVGYVQVFHDLGNYYVIRARLLFWLLVVELFGTSLAYLIILITTRRFLKPLHNLHEVMRNISENPNNLNLRSDISSGDEIEELSVIFDNMLDMVRVQGSFEGHQNDMTVLEDSIETVVGNFRVLREDFIFTWQSENPKTIARIYKNHFEQALMILIDNAVKYSRKEKKIAINLSVTGKQEAIVRVQDKGEGISKEDIEHIFERFYRTDKSRNRTSTQAGLGIGLSILKQIVDGYHLQMKVESELNEGSVFILHIPLAQSKES
ncbi:sensor histidine kinase [Streptococcus pyogenes]|uniref:sensor histidine kinase n=1 Tax=Streptococcus pyogenes TaxID=1314 RepID=UPI00132FBDD7|nr:ATP-binding protein [Streptococcus pyogenes]